jgi:hypothetical protein
MKQMADGGWRMAAALMADRSFADGHAHPCSAIRHLPSAICRAAISAAAIRHQRSRQQS